MQHIGGAEELQQTEARVPGEMEKRDRVEAERDLDDDDPHLRQRGIGQRGLHVALDARHQRREQGRGQSEDSGEQPGGSCLLEQRRGAQQQEAAGMDRQRPVVDRARRRRSFHRARQPARERQQRALSRDGDDQEHGDRRCRGGGQCGRAWHQPAAEEQRQAPAAGEVMQQHSGRQHRGVADPVDRKHTQRVGDRRRPLVKEPDQQRRAQAHELPAGEQHFDVAGECDEQHAGDEHRKQHEVAVVSRFAVQIAVGEGGHDSRDRRHQRGKRQRHAIEQELDGNASLVRRGPRAIRHEQCAAPRRHVDDERGRDRGKRHGHRPGRDSARPALLQGAVEERRHPERGEDQRGRSDADEHQQLERERRDHPRVTADTAFQSVLDTAA